MFCILARIIYRYRLFRVITQQPQVIHRVCNIKRVVFCRKLQEYNIKAAIRSKLYKLLMTNNENISQYLIQSNNNPNCKRGISAYEITRKQLLKNVIINNNSNKSKCIQLPAKQIYNILRNQSSIIIYNRQSSSNILKSSKSSEYKSTYNSTYNSCTNIIRRYYLPRWNGMDL